MNRGDVEEDQVEAFEEWMEAGAAEDAAGQDDADGS